MQYDSAHREIILAGSGGQGLIVSGILLAEAAMREGRNVVQTQSYGIASRGGLSLAEVIIDDAEIIYQQVSSPNCILALSEEAAKKYDAWAAKGVTFLYDRTLVRERTGRGCIGCEFTRKATELGNAGSVNILALAAVAAVTSVVKPDSLEQLLRQRFHGTALDLNLEMLGVGGEWATV